MGWWCFKQVQIHVTLGTSQSPGMTLQESVKEWMLWWQHSTYPWLLIYLNCLAFLLWTVHCKYPPTAAFGLLGSRILLLFWCQLSICIGSDYGRIELLGECCEVYGNMHQKAKPYWVLNETVMILGKIPALMVFGRYTAWHFLMQISAAFMFCWGTFLPFSKVFVRGI